MGAGRWLHECCVLRARGDGAAAWRLVLELRHSLHQACNLLAELGHFIAQRSNLLAISRIRQSEREQCRLSTSHVQKQSTTYLSCWFLVPCNGPGAYAHASPPAIHRSQLAPSTGMHLSFLFLHSPLLISNNEHVIRKNRRAPAPEVCHTTLPTCICHAWGDDPRASLTPTPVASAALGQPR